MVLAIQRENDKKWDDDDEKNGIVKNYLWKLKIFDWKWKAKIGQN